MITESLEPRTRGDLALSLLSSCAIGIAVALMVGLPLGCAWFVWQLPAPELVAMMLVFLVGLEVACGFVLLRLTRDDRGIGARLRLASQYEAVCKERDNWRKIAEGAQPVVMPARDDAKFVRARVRDAAWTDASSLLVLCKGDFGVIPGRRDANLTQAAWESAVAVLAGVNALAYRGRRYELVMTVAEARQRLEEVQ